VAQRGEGILGIYVVRQDIPLFGQCKCGKPATVKVVWVIVEGSPAHQAAEREGLGCVIGEDGAQTIQWFECEDCNRRGVQAKHLRQYIEEHN